MNLIKSIFDKFGLLNRHSSPSLHTRDVTAGHIHQAGRDITTQYISITIINQCPTRNHLRPLFERPGVEVTGICHLGGQQKVTRGEAERIRYEKKQQTPGGEHALER